MCIISSTFPILGSELDWYRNIGILINYYSVVEQGYSTEPSNEYIVRGNDALMKCKIPSYAADMAEVTGWGDSEGHDYRMGNNYGNLINSSS